MSQAAEAKSPRAPLAFFDFPARHWIHIRSINVIESTFATIRHRTDRTKGCLTSARMLAMIFKVPMSAEQGWRRSRGFEWLANVTRGVMFRDGIEVRTKKRASLRQEVISVAA